MWAFMKAVVGGPIGMALGATAGGLAGVIYDVVHAGVSHEFLDEVSAALTPDKAAVLAEVNEDWVTPVDVRLRKLGGRVFRRQPAEVVEDQLNREAAAIDAELKALEAELAQASAENRAALQADIESTRQKLEELDNQVVAKEAEVQAEVTARLEAMRDQAKTASEARKAHLEKRIAEAQAKYEVRRAKLEQAHKLIKEALGPNQAA
jgi:hypothetical protein